MGTEARRPALRGVRSGLETARQALGGQYELVWNGIDVDLVNSVEPWPTSGPTVCSGRHEPRKGLAVLVDAVVNHGVDARIWVAGEAPLHAAIKEATMGDTRFEWLGTVGEEEKLRRLRGADVLVAPSLRGESFGVVLLEGMAARATAVASNIPGYATWPSIRLTSCRSCHRATPVAGRPCARPAGASTSRPCRSPLTNGPPMHSLDALARRYLDLYETLLAP